MSGNIPPIEGILISLGMGVLSMGAAVFNFKRLREIEDHPCSKVQTAAQGLAELEGFAWPKHPGPKNVHGDPLVYYHFQLQKQVTIKSGKNTRREWKTVFSRTHAAPFYMVDPTGLVTIEPAQAKLLFNSSTTRPWKQLNVQEQAHLLENVVNEPIESFPPSGSFLGLLDTPFRIVETAVHEGSPIYAKGDFHSPQATPEKVNLTGLSIFSAQVFDRNARKIKALQSLFDLNGNGKINYHELSHGYLKLARFARTQHGREQSHQTEFTVYGVLQHSEEHGLLLADTHQTQLIDSLKSRTRMFMAAGCVLLTLASVLWFRAK